MESVVVIWILYGVIFITVFVTTGTLLSANTDLSDWYVWQISLVVSLVYMLLNNLLLKWFYNDR